MKRNQPHTALDNVDVATGPSVSSVGSLDMLTFAEGSFSMQLIALQERLEVVFGGSDPLAYPVNQEELRELHRALGAESAASSLHATMNWVLRFCELQEDLISLKSLGSQPSMGDVKDHADSLRDLACLVEDMGGISLPPLFATLPEIVDGLWLNAETTLFHEFRERSEQVMSGLFLGDPGGNAQSAFDVLRLAMELGLPLEEITNKTDLNHWFDCIHDQGISYREFVIKNQGSTPEQKVAQLSNLRRLSAVTAAFVEEVREGCPGGLVEGDPSVYLFYGDSDLVHDRQALLTGGETVAQSMPSARLVDGREVPFQSSTVFEPGLLVGHQETLRHLTKERRSMVRETKAREMLRTLFDVLDEDKSLLPHRPSIVVNTVGRDLGYVDNFPAGKQWGARGMTLIAVSSQAKDQLSFDSSLLHELIHTVPSVLGEEEDTLVGFCLISADRERYSGFEEAAVECLMMLSRALHEVLKNGDVSREEAQEHVRQVLADPSRVRLDDCAYVEQVNALLGLFEVVDPSDRADLWKALLGSRCVQDPALPLSELADERVSQFIHTFNWLNNAGHQLKLEDIDVLFTPV